MPLDTLHRLPQIPGSAMLMIRMGCPMLMENNALLLSRILRVMDMSDMPRILRLDRHIIILRQLPVMSGKHLIAVPILPHNHRIQYAVFPNALHHVIPTFPLIQPEGMLPERADAVNGSILIPSSGAATSSAPARRYTASLKIFLFVPLASI